MTAPASGSGTCPACTARVPKRRLASSANAFVMAGTEGRLSRRASDHYVKRTMPQPNAVKCLVVDDEPRLRRVLVRLLEGEGFTCTEALEIMQHDPVPLVISDLRMPQMDGVTLLREVIAQWPDTAVIVVTAVAEVESAVACLQLG